MLTDPENLEEQPFQYDEPILANSPEEAERICFEIAQRDEVKIIKIQQPQKIQRGKNQEYRCVFETNSIE